MAQISKAAARRGKPSYIMSIIGVTLVLFLLGIVGWMVINASKLGDTFRENVEVKVYLKEGLTPKDSTSIMAYFASAPYVKTHSYVDKAKAREIYLGGGTEEDFNEVLDDYNPLPNAIYFNPKQQYVQVDSLESISREIDSLNKGLVSDIDYPKELVTSLDKNIRKASLILLVLAIILSVVVIILIDNTIRLATFSNRFLIKTMQMVGATRNFIARPLNIRAIINGAISAAIAIVLVYILIRVAESIFPDLRGIRSTSNMIVLFITLLLIGITITLFSTYRSVLKYLRLKLDELY